MPGWTTPRTWTDGELVTKAIMDPHIRDNLNFLRSQGARTTADQSNGSTSFADATGVLFTIGASETWVVSIHAVMHVGGSEDNKTAWTVPSGATGRHWYNSGGALGASTQSLGSDLVAGSSGTADNIVEWGAVIVNSTNAGTCQWRFAQFAGGAEPAILRANAVMIAQRIA